MDQRMGFRRARQVVEMEDLFFQGGSSISIGSNKLLERVSAVAIIINHVDTEAKASTTGLPKGAEISHYNIISNSAQVAFKRNMVAETRSGNDRKERLRLSGERWLAPLPMFHAYVR